MASSPASQTYRRACQREGTDCVLEVLNTFNNNERELTLSHRKVPLTDVDVCCLAEGLTAPHAVRLVDLEENPLGVDAVQALVDSFSVNPGTVRELRLGKTNLRDAAAVALGNALGSEGSGLKVLDLSQNTVTKLGAQALVNALESRACDLVELSFHCNELDQEAVVPLAQALRVATKLKHLHLGYNVLRDRGAQHLARALPIAHSLLTLDLTANRIGAQGGADLVKALLNEHTSIQRLNLRHNNLDDDTMVLFNEVLQRNKKLTQLFLGYMNPSFETAKSLLATLARKNDTMMCFDIFGWRLDDTDVVADLLDRNRTLRALITDAPLDDVVEVGNQKRSDDGRFAVYVGGDDRLAAMASATPKTTGGSRSVSQVGQVGTSPRPYRSPPRSTQPLYSGNQRQPSPSAIRQPAQQQQSAVRSPKTRRTRTAVEGEKEQLEADEDLDRLLEEFQHTEACDPECRNHLSLILAQLQLRMEVQRGYHQQQITDLQNRVVALEDDRAELRAALASSSSAAPHVKADSSRSPNYASTPTQQQKTQSSPKQEKQSERASSPTATQQQEKTQPVTSPKQPPQKERTSSPQREAQPRAATPPQQQQQQQQQQSRAEPQTPGSPEEKRATPQVGQVAERNDRVMTSQRPQRPEAVDDQRSPAATGRRDDRSPEPRVVSHRSSAGGAVGPKGQPPVNNVTPRSASAGRDASTSSVPETPLYVPTPRGGIDSARTSHSPAPLIDEQAPTPDLQHSRHQSGHAVMSQGPPGKSAPPSRPKGPSHASGLSYR